MYPLAKPPPGVIPNFVNPESHAYQLTITVAVCLAFVIIAVSMRLYTKQFITKSMGWDDCKSNPENTYAIADQRAVTCILGAVKPLRYCNDGDWSLIMVYQMFAITYDGLVAGGKY